jgi:hypothetical protein
MGVGKSLHLFVNCVIKYVRAGNGIEGTEVPQIVSLQASGSRFRLAGITSPTPRPGNSHMVARFWKERGEIVSTTSLGYRAACGVLVEIGLIRRGYLTLVTNSFIFEERSRTRMTQ